MKYQRDISSTLTLLALGLGLFVGYQVWLKPTYLTPLPAVEPPSTTVPLPSSPRFPLPGAPSNQLWDVPPSRLVDLGPAPNQTLGSIRDELDRGNYDKVDQRLRTFSRKQITKKPTGQYIAALWNNLGVQQEKFGGSALSIKAFKQSVTWNPKSPIAQLNLTQAYWELRDPAMTPRFLETVIQLAPQDPFPHLALADLLLSKGNIASAATHLDQASSLAERDPNNRSYFLKLSAKIGASVLAEAVTDATIQAPHAAGQEVSQSSESPKTHPSSPPLEPTRQSGPAGAPPSEAQPAQSGAAHFTIQFDGPPDQATEARMRAILEYAYQELSQKFGQPPMKPVTVVLHTNQQFASEAGSPLWADRLYHRPSGTIHLPTQNALEDLALFSRVARHEFAHVLLHEQVEGVTAGAPTWLIEGLAMQLADDPWAEVEETAQKIGALMPLTSLHGDWKQFSDEAVRIAYLEARSAVQTLVDRYNIYGVRQIMKLLQQGQSLDTAMKQQWSVSYEQFQQQWEQTPRSSMRSSGS